MFKTTLCSCALHSSPVKVKSNKGAKTDNMQGWQRNSSGNNDSGKRVSETREEAIRESIHWMVRSIRNCLNDWVILGMNRCEAKAFRGIKAEWSRESFIRSFDFHSTCSDRLLLSPYVFRLQSLSFHVNFKMAFISVWIFFSVPQNYYQPHGYHKDFSDKYAATYSHGSNGEHGSYESGSHGSYERGSEYGSKYGMILDFLKSAHFVWNRIIQHLNQLKNHSGSSHGYGEDPHSYNYGYNSHYQPHYDEPHSYHFGIPHDHYGTKFVCMSTCFCYM